MIDPDTLEAIDKVFASTPAPATVWGVRYTERGRGKPAGHIDWCGREDRAVAWLAMLQVAGYRAQLVRLTGHPVQVP